MIDNEKLICWCKGFIPSYHRSPESKIPIWHPVINCSLNISKADRKRKRERFIASIWKSQLKFKPLGMKGERREKISFAKLKMLMKELSPGRVPLVESSQKLFDRCFLAPTQPSGERLRYVSKLPPERRMMKLDKVFPVSWKASDKNLPPGGKSKAVAFWNFTPIEIDSHGSNY